MKPYPLLLLAIALSAIGCGGQSAVQPQSLSARSYHGTYALNGITGEADAQVSAAVVTIDLYDDLHDSLTLPSGDIVSVSPFEVKATVKGQAFRFWGG